MILYLLGAFIVAGGLLVDAQDIDPNCQVKVNTTLEECLSSFVFKWDDIRKVKPQIDALVYPLWTLSLDEVRSLCLRVEEAQDKCGVTPIEKCQKNEVARFIQQNFLYACNSKSGSLFGDSSECLLSTINSRQDCIMLLKKTDDQNADGCTQLSQFLKCVHDDVHKACKAKGVAALVHGIDRFGCDVAKLEVKLGAQDQVLPNCLPPDWQAVTNCFQPLLNMWAEIRDNDTSLLETGFPVFKFDRADMAKMCEMVHGIRDQCSLQVQRCPSHQLPEFTNSLLGLACGNQQAVFFLSYDCIRRAIIENTQCHPYTVGAWQPGHLKELCTRLPQFYKCLERPIAAKCANDGVNVLAQSIRQFGCELNVEPLPPATAAPTPNPPPVVTSTQPVPTLPTGAPATGPPGNNGFILSDRPNQSPAAPSPFLNAAPASAPLISGPQEPLFKLPVVADQQQARAPAATVAVTLPQPAAPAPIAAPAPAPAAQPAVPQQVIQPPAQPQPAPSQPLQPQTPPNPQPQIQTPQNQSQLKQPTQSPVAPPAIPAQTQAPAALPTTPETTTPTTTHASTPLPGERKPVQPIPLVPHLLEICDIQRRNEARKCLHPLFKRWVQVHTRMLTETFRSNLTFPLYHYARSEVIELCDQYATAFLQCPFSVFQECLRDEVVFLSNAMLGYACSPQNIPEFTRHFDCISTVLRARNQCSDPIHGALLIGRDEATRCSGVKQFYECNKQSVKDTCTSAAERVFKETVRQFGCELENKQ